MSFLSSVLWCMTFLRRTTLSCELWLMRAVAWARTTGGHLPGSTVASHIASAQTELKAVSDRRVSGLTSYVVVISHNSLRCSVFQSERGIV